MARYIDADKMLANICAECLDKGTDECKNGNCTERNWINNTPTEDVQPVVHAKVTDYYCCSNCQYPFDLENMFEINYCPNCGAKLK